jgi:hypothetical protein
MTIRKSIEQPLTQTHDQPAELRADYRFFLRASQWLARLTLAGGIFLVWYLAAYVAMHHPVSVGIFLLVTTALCLLASFVFGLAAFVLFKRRGGRVVRAEPPAGLEPTRRHFGPPPSQ